MKTNIITINSKTIK